MLLGACDVRRFGLGIASPASMRSNLVTEEIPHDDAAGCCLAAPRMHYISRADLGELSYDVEAMICAAWAYLRPEVVKPAYVAVTHDRSHH
jgi:hypothetical protein